MYIFEKKKKRKERFSGDYANFYIISLSIPTWFSVTSLGTLEFHLFQRLLFSTRESREDGDDRGRCLPTIDSYLVSVDSQKCRE